MRAYEREGRLCGLVRGAGGWMVVGGACEVGGEELVGVYRGLVDVLGGMERRVQEGWDGVSGAWETMGVVLASVERER